MTEYTTPASAGDDDNAGRTRQSLDIANRLERLGLDTDAGLLTTGEASKALGYRNERTLRNLRARGEGPPAIKLPSGAVRYSARDLAIWALEAEARGSDQLIWQACRERDRQEKRKARDRERHRQRRASVDDN